MPHWFQASGVIVNHIVRFILSFSLLVLLSILFLVIYINSGRAGSSFFGAYSSSSGTMGSWLLFDWISGNLF